MHQESPPSKVASNDQLGPDNEARCMCGEMLLSACPGEWEPGCDLGNNPAHARPVRAVLDTDDSDDSWLDDSDECDRCHGDGMSAPTPDEFEVLNA